MTSSDILIARRGKAGDREYNDHWMACTRECKPFVVVRHKVKYSYIRIDLFPAKHSLSDPARERIFHLLFGVTYTGGTVGGTTEAVYAGKVKRDEAEETARTVYKIAIDDIGGSP